MIVGERTLGVIEFFTQRLREPAADLLELISTLGGSLGQFLGPLVGGSMLAWRAWSPYALAAFTLLVLGGLTARAGPSLYDGVVAGDDGEEPPQKRRRIRRRGAG